LLDPTQLFSYESSIDMRTVRASTMVVTLGSYLDAGHTQQILDDHLLNLLPNYKLGHFDVDQVFDYAGHRPHITFDHDHFTDFRTPEIILHHVLDAQGRPFLLLTGPEPALQWERMAAAIEHVIKQFDVTQTVLLHGFPAPAPHTRPVLVTQYASDPALVPVRSGIPASFEMSASFDALLTLRLGQKNHAVIGLSAHVPHYLTGLDYPEAAVALLDKLIEVTQLNLPQGELPVQAAVIREQINTQIGENPELQATIATVEQHYDAMVQDRGLPIKQEDLPTADQIGEELEDFLQRIDAQSKSGDISLLLGPTDVVPPSPANPAPEPPEKPNTAKPDDPE